MTPRPGGAAEPGLQGLDAALVDLDGTLVDTLGDFERALALALGGLGQPAVPAAALARMVGRGSEHLLRACLAYLGASPDLYSRLWVDYQRHYLDINGQHSSVYPGVVEGLARLRAAGLRLACLTNKPQAFAEPLLRAKGLRRWFDAVYGGDAFERKKPDPLPLLQACRRLAVIPSRCLMVGDSCNDAQAARAAGCPVVLARYGYNHGKPVEAAGADALFDRLDQVRWPPLGEGVADAAGAPR